MTTYTISVLNQSGETKSYVIFQAPPPLHGRGGETPVYANVWATFSSITNGDYDSLVYAEADVMPGSEAGGPAPAPSFYVAEGDDAPGQVIDTSQASDAAAIDFAGRSHTTATVTQDAGGGFSVQYG